MGCGLSRYCVFHPEEEVGISVQVEVARSWCKQPTDAKEFKLAIQKYHPLVSTKIFLFLSLIIL